MISLLLLPLAAALLASISGGVIGSYVVVKRLANMCGSITHSILGGMGFFLWLQKAKGIAWCDPLIGAFLASLISALLIGWIHLRFRERVDAVIAAVWSTGMAIGVIFLALTPGSTGDLSNFLLGNLLWISPRDLALLFGLNLLILFVVSCYYRSFLLISFDEDQALLHRIPVQKITFLLLALIALAIVLFIQMIGTILTIALLTLPATTANLFVHRLRPLMIGAILSNAIVSTLGIWLSYLLNFPPGATISLCAALLYFAALFVKKKKIFLSHPTPREG